MNLFRTRKLFGIDQLSQIHHQNACRMSTTPRHDPPPPDTLSGNHPEPLVHPRMNCRSVPRVSYNVRAPIAFHLSCITIVCYACLVFIVSSPLSYCPVVPTIDADA